MNKNFEKASKNEEAEKNEDRTSKERVEVQQEEPPWEELKRESEKSLIEECQENFEISEEAKDQVDGYLSQEDEQVMFKFAGEWFKENKDIVKEGGYDIKSKNDKYILTAVSELRGLDEIENNEEYQEFKEGRDNIAFLRTVLKGDTTSIQDQHLILNRLNVRGERIGKELKEAVQRGDEATVESKEIEFSSLFKVKKEFGEKLSDRNLRDDAIREKKLGSLETEDEYVSKNVSPKLEEIGKNLQQKGEGKEGVIKTLLQELGLTKEEKGILIKKIIIKEGDEIMEKLAGKKELDEFLKDKLKSKIESKFKEEWGEKNAEREYEIARFAEKELKKLGSLPERAIGGIEAVYDEAKKKFCDEAAKKVRGKTAKELREIEKEFKKEGENPKEFIDDVLSREGVLKKLTGEWGEDKKKIVEFLEDYGISGSEELLEEFDKGGKKYTGEVKKSRGFLEWLIKAGFSITEQHD